MKNIVKFLLFLVLVNLSCSKPQDEILASKTETTQSVNGKWRVVSKVKNGVNIPLDNCIQNAFIQFSPNTAYSQAISKYSISSQLCITNTYFGTYTYSNNNLEASKSWAWVLSPENKKTSFCKFFNNAPSTTLSTIVLSKIALV